MAKNTMRRIAKECNGCTLIQKPIRPCFGRTYDAEHLCPCRDCVVKVMCSNTCDTYNDWANDLLKELTQNGK